MADVLFDQIVKEGQSFWSAVYAPFISRDLTRDDLRGLVKINPIAMWSDLDVQGYIKDHDVPVNPLVDQGYPSIGCQPCTHPVEPGADPLPRTPLVPAQRPHRARARTRTAPAAGRHREQAVTDAQHPGNRAEAAAT